MAYFLLYGRDLRRAGYRPFDVVRVYALNLLLVGANLAGVLKSLHQASTGKRTAFHRTPKVAGRTAAPPIHVVLPVAALVYLGLAILWDGIAGNLLHAALSAGNALSSATRSGPSSAGGRRARTRHRCWRGCRGPSSAGLG